MAYAKKYKPQHIRLIGTSKGETTYLFLFWNYGFGIPSIGPNGKVKTKYMTLRISTGHSVPNGSWISAVAGSKSHAKEDGDFSPSFIRSSRAKFNEITADVEDLRSLIFDFYTKHVKENNTKPHPDQIHTAVKGKSVSVVRIRLSDYIRQHAYSPLVTNTRTAAKFKGLAAILDILVEARKTNPLKSRMLGSGDIFVDSMCEADWIDLQTMIQRAGCQLNRTNRKARSKGKEGIPPLKWIDQIGMKPFYSVNTLEKLQQNLKTVMAVARKKNMTNLDIDALIKVSRKQIRKEHLEPEEIAKVIAARFDEPHLENTRKLFVVELMTGVPVGGMRRLLDRPITTIKGKHIIFPAVWSIRDKTGTQHLIPLFQPAYDLLTGPDKPYMISDQNYNDLLKIICVRMGLDRAFHVLEPKANGDMLDKLAPISSQVSTHTCRRTLKTLLEGDLQVARERVCDMFGHSYGDKSADRVYMVITPERSAELLIRHILSEQDILPFQLIGNCVRRNELAKRD